MRPGGILTEARCREKPREDLAVKILKGHSGCDVGENDWTRVDASDALSDVVARARAHLGESPEGTTPAAGSPVKFEKGETRDG